MDFSKFKIFVRANQKILAALVLLVIASGIAFMYRDDAIISLNRFFAATPGPSVVLNNYPGGAGYRHGDVVDASWSANTAVSCTASNWIDTGEANEGRASSNPINACAASNGSFNITCCYLDGTCGTTGTSFKIDQSTCPTASTAPTPIPSPIPVIGGCEGTGGICVSASSACTGSFPRSSNLTCESPLKCCLPSTTTVPTPIPTPSPVTGSCEGTGGICVSASSACTGSFPRSSNLTCESPLKCCLPTASTAPTPTATGSEGGICAGAAQKHTDSQTGVTVCILSSSFSSNRCTVGASGTIQQVVGVDNTNEYGVSGYVRSSGYHDPIDDCGATQAEAFAYSPSGPASIPFNGSGTYTFSWNIDSMSCGRVQLDACFFLDGHGCSDTDGWNILGKVVSSGKGSCVTPSPPSLLVSSSAPTVTSSIPSSSPVITPSPTPIPSPSPLPLVCSPLSQTVNVDQIAILSASGGSTSQGNTSFIWSAPGGTPSGADSGATFGTIYGATGDYTVTVTASGAGQVANCTVKVVEPPPGLACSPSNQSVYVNQTANFSASGGQGAYLWSAPGGEPSSGSGPTFGASYAAAGQKTVTVRNSETGPTERCDVTVNTVPAPTPTPSPAPTTPSLGISKLVRDITTGGALADMVAANPNDTVEFAINITSSGTATVRNAIIRDSLPFGLSYLSGTTAIDGVTTSDGIISAGISLGDIVQGRTLTVRFRAQVLSESAFSVGTSILTNTATVTSDNTSPVSDTAFVSITKTNPIIISNETYDISVQKLGRNITRGEFAEQSSVYAAPSETIEFLVRIRSLSTVRIDNVKVKDIIPTGIAYLSSTTSVGGVLMADDIVSGAGLNIGSLDPNQTVLVRFSGKVNPANSIPLGTTTVINTVQASSSQIPAVMAQLPVVIFNGSVAGAVIVPTGPSESILLALAISGLITFLYVVYTRTDVFRRREIQSIVRKDKTGEEKINFRQ